MSTEPGTPTTDPAEPTTTAAVAGSGERAVKPRRSASSIALLVVGALVTAALVIFIVQNLRSSRVEFLGLAWTLPLGLNMLLAALAGALVAGIVAAVRILALRRAVRRQR